MDKWEKVVDFVFHYIGIVVLGGAWFIYKLFYPFYKNIHPTACKVIDWTNGKKTYIVALLGILTLLWSYHKHVVDLQNVVMNLPMLVLAMTFRHGMARHTVPKLEGGDKEDTLETVVTVSVTTPQSSSSSSSSSSHTKHPRRHH